MMNSIEVSRQELSAKHLENQLHQQMLDYSRQTIQQLVSITEYFEQNSSLDYQNPVGAHIRHLIDHYDALLRPSADIIDYDVRARNPQIERHPDLAKKHLIGVLKMIEGIELDAFSKRFCVYLSGGKNGTFRMKADSSLARELIFLNSHTVHHLAIIKPHCCSIGMSIDKNFGVAPSTIAYQQQQQ
jgi:hypothetical protein